MKALYRRFPSILIARRNISRTKLRSALAMLGIIIGVVAIASLGVLGTAIQGAFLAGFGDVGSDVVVSPDYDNGVESLSERDVTRIRRASTDATVLPIQQDRGVVAYGSEETVVQLYGVSDPGSAYGVSDGRMPRRLRSGVLVGSAMAERLGVRAGNSVTIGEETYRVKGVLAKQTGFSPVSPNTAILVPPSTIEKEGYSQVLVSAEDGEAANESAMNIREGLNQRENRVTVVELSAIVDQIGSFFDILNKFLVAIGTISLFVAGVSILNVMLMSTVERREEIGVMRSVGYRKRQVLKIMLAEAGILGVVGGVIGLGVSLAAGLVINHFIVGDAMAVFSQQNLFYLLLAFGFGVATSLISGLYPAWKAANENPVEAIRS